MLSAQGSASCSHRSNSVVNRTVTTLQHHSLIASRLRSSSSKLVASCDCTPSGAAAGSSLQGEQTITRSCLEASTSYRQPPSACTVQSAATSQQALQLEHVLQAAGGLTRALRRGRLGMQRLHRTMSSHGRGALFAMSFISVPALPGSGIQDLLSNRVFMAGFWAWLGAQVLKIFTKRFKKGVWDFRAMLEPGGMPSSHSSLCTSVTTAIAFEQGLGSPLFAAALCFSVIVMYDAMGVRRHAGKHAEVLNQVINELMEDHPVVGDTKLKEVLGHTPRQVACGALFGVVMGALYPGAINGIAT